MVQPAPQGREDPLDRIGGQSYFKPEELKVFDKLPADQINTRIHETFVPLAPRPRRPRRKAEWQSQREKWMTALREKCFRGWPDESQSS